jgi:hypothetical protein
MRGEGGAAGPGEMMSANILALRYGASKPRMRAASVFSLRGRLKGRFGVSKRYLDSYVTRSYHSLVLRLSLAPAVGGVAASTGPHPSTHAHSTVAGLGIFGVETASFAAILAGVGLAVGLALQGTLSNFSAGLCCYSFVRSRWAT